MNNYFVILTIAALIALAVVVWTACGGSVTTKPRSTTGSTANGALCARRTPMKWICKGHYPDEFAEPGDPLDHNIRVCCSPEEAEQYRKGAQQAADEFYSLDNLPPGWEYATEDYFDGVIRKIWDRHDEEFKRVCAEEGVAWHYSQEGYDDAKRDEVYFRTAEEIGKLSNPYDPLMWYRSGPDPDQRPRYYVEQVPGG